MRWFIKKSHLVWLIAVLTAALVAMAFMGCASERQQAEINSAATIWEGADAIERGASPAKVTPTIKANAAAIIKSNGGTYAPAGVKP